jgi:hypothetical protein
MYKETEAIPNASLEMTLTLARGGDGRRDLIHFRGERYCMTLANGCPDLSSQIGPLKMNGTSCTNIPNMLDMLAPIPFLRPALTPHCHHGNGRTDTAAAWRANPAPGYFLSLMFDASQTTARTARPGLPNEPETTAFKQSLF